MKKQSFLCGLSAPVARFVLLALLLVVFSASAHAAMVRGRLERVGSKGVRYPASGIAVTLNKPRMGRSSPAYSRADDLYNVPPGSYSLEIWISRDPRMPPRGYQIQVNDPYTDIRPIVVP